MRCARAAAALWLLPALACATAPAPLAQLEDGTYAMGTLLEIRLAGGDAAALARARDAAFAEVRRLEPLLDDWSERSDVSRLNRAAGTGPVRVAPELAELLGISLRFASATRGSFDVSVGPLVALWREAGRRGALPSQAEIARAHAQVGASRIEILADGRVALPAGMRIDLGGVAKGFALDRSLPLVRAAGASSALLNFGQSSSLALGAPPDSPEGWRLLARAPEGGFDGVLTLRDRALSVSGSLGQWVEIEGRRYGHVIDPRSGRPLERRRQALVVAPDATRAEALSKALLVLGEREGLEVVASQPGCEGLLLDEGGGRVATPGWDALTRYRRLPAAASGLPADAPR
jgi:thiamine biosynthesis lipoprotein